MGAEVEQPPERKLGRHTAEQVRAVSSAGHFLHGYAKAEDAEDHISKIDHLLGVLVDEVEEYRQDDASVLRRAILDHFQGRRGKELTFEMEQEANGLISELTELASDSVLDTA
jgi:hypothetical protein